MRRYLAAYALWLLGVLSAAALALYYYKRIIAMGDDALQRELHLSSPGRSRAPEPPLPSPEPEAVAFDDTVSLEDARPPSFEDLRGRRPVGTD